MKTSEQKNQTTESHSVDRATKLSRMNSEKDCKKKIKHETVKDARQHILELSKHGTKPFGSYYHCIVCHGYHVTSLPPKGNFRKQ
jgi:hypothetical protein